MLHYQLAVTSSQSVGQRNPVGDKIALYLRLPNCDLSSKSDKIDKGSKTMSCNNLTQLQQRHKHDVGQLWWDCEWGKRRSWRSNELRERPCRDSRNRP